MAGIEPVVTSAASPRAFNPDIKQSHSSVTARKNKETEATGGKEMDSIDVRKDQAAVLNIGCGAVVLAVPIALPSKLKMQPVIHEAQQSKVVKLASGIAARQEQKNIYVTNVNGTQQGTDEASLRAESVVSRIVDEQSVETVARQTIQEGAKSLPAVPIAQGDTFSGSYGHARTQQAGAGEKIILPVEQRENDAQVSQIPVRAESQFSARIASTQGYGNSYKTIAASIDNISKQEKSTTLGEHAKQQAEIPTVFAQGVHSSPIKDMSKNEQQISQVNTFQGMDSEEPQTTLIKSNPHQVAIGVRDPSLGWIEIQMQTSSGHINASLTTSSSEAHAKLVAETPALTQYIVEHDVPVHSVHVTLLGGEANNSQSNSRDAQQQEWQKEQAVLAGSRIRQIDPDEEVETRSSGSAARHISVKA